MNLEGHKELLGLWLSEAEGAKFWLSCMTDLKNRGVRDVFIICVDGLAGFPEAIHAAFPEAKVQLCIVHMVHAALRYVSTQDSAEVIADLKKSYQAATVLDAEESLDKFAAKWDAKYPTIAKMWRQKWPSIITLFDFAEPIRKAIYTTNAPKNRKELARNKSADTKSGTGPPLANHEKRTGRDN